MKFSIITLFPDMFQALSAGVVGRAQQAKRIELDFTNPRDFATDPHRTVDDRPYGGGPGMVMQAQPLEAAIQAIRNSHTQPIKSIYLSPQGRPLTHQAVAELSQLPQLILVAGRYEGIDQRFLDHHIDEEWSIGDFVVSGGELPAMMLIDAVTRLLPGVLGHPQSAEQDSFASGLLDCPHYTRPEQFNDESVPNVLLSGDHQAIARWRLKQSLGKTWQMRPDLLKRRVLTADEKTLLEEYISEQAN